MQRLIGRRAIVTGGASGFGAGIVRRFVHEGATVAIADIDVDAARRLVDECGDAAHAVQVDVSSDASVDAMVARVVDLLGGVDVLVNNAGIGHLPTPLDELSEDTFDRLFAVNAKSVYLTARHVVPHLRRGGGGAILNVASTGGVSPRPNLTWYNASKGWMITASKGMAVELAADGIRVNAINPVAGETPLLATFMGGDTPETRQRFLSTLPLGRFSTPEDIGAAAAFLCSDDASMITGVALEIDGGRCV